MVQIPWNMRGSNSKMLQYWWTGTFRSKMLQTARKMDRTGNNQKHTGKNNTPKQFRTPDKFWIDSELIWTKPETNHKPIRYEFQINPI